MAAEVPVLRLPQPPQRHVMRPLFFSVACAKLIRMKMQSAWQYNPGSFKVDDETTIPLKKTGRSQFFRFSGCLSWRRRVPCSSRAAGSAVMVPAAVAMVAAALCFAPSSGASHHQDWHLSILTKTVRQDVTVDYMYIYVNIYFLWQI